MCIYMGSPSTCPHCIRAVSFQFQYLVMAIKINGLIPSSVPEEVWVVLQSLAEEWGDVIDDMLRVVPLKGGMTNEVYQINWPTNAGGGGCRREVLVRLYGDGVELFFNRQDEMRTFECMSRHGQGPKLLATFAGGRVEDFIHARTLSAADLHKAEISGLVAKKLKEFHNLDMPGPRDVLLLDRLRTWLGEAKSVCTKQDAIEFCLDSLDEEIRVLEQELSREDKEIGFCHNDLQYGNIMIDDQTNAITIIDYEYASFNPVAYDIANHFCEMAANYHSKKPHILDYSKYPDLQERQRFIHAYLTSSGGHKPNEGQVEKLVNDTERYTLASHLFWGLWGLISGYVNKIEFNYMEYARQRFKQYWLRRPLCLPSHCR